MIPIEFTPIGRGRWLSCVPDDRGNVIRSWLIVVNHQGTFDAHLCIDAPEQLKREGIKTFEMACDFCTEEDAKLFELSA